MKNSVKILALLMAGIFAVNALPVSYCLAANQSFIFACPANSAQSASTCSSGPKADLDRFEACCEDSGQDNVNQNCRLENPKHPATRVRESSCSIVFYSQLPAKLKFFPMLQLPSSYFVDDLLSTSPPFYLLYLSFLN